VVFGAFDPKAGAAGGIIDAFALKLFTPEQYSRVNNMCLSQTTLRNQTLCPVQHDHPL
jgi:hypothetical protein